MDHEEFNRWDEERKRRRKEREARRAERQRPRRDEPQADRGGDRKDHVLHTRISEQLDETLRHAAGEMRVPVSNLVRNVLEDVFDVVETVTENVEDLVENLMDEAEAVRGRFGRRRHTRHARDRRRSDPEFEAAEREIERDVEGEAVGSTGTDAAAATDETTESEDRAEFGQVVGWQPLVLNGEQRCADCGRDLMRGDQAYLGVGAGGSASLYLCKECLDARG